jgi:hypothetical protein
LHSVLFDLLTGLIRCCVDHCYSDIAFFEKIPPAERWMYIETGNAELRLQELKLKIVNMGYTGMHSTLCHLRHHIHQPIVPKRGCF